MGDDRNGGDNKNPRTSARGAFALRYLPGVMRPGGALRRGAAKLLRLLLLDGGLYDGVGNAGLYSLISFLCIVL